MEWREPEATDARRVYGTVHSQEYIREIYEAAYSSKTPIFIDPDTYVSRGTIKALNRLAGAITHAVDLALSGVRYTFLLGRPPGHHAGRNGIALGAPTLGFCIFNTVAVIATLLARRGKVAVLDFDLHHGNGTQEILWNTGILHVDIHQDPATIYPGTGFPWQRGRNGNLVNILLPPGAGDDIFMDAVNLPLERIAQYDPDYMVVSAGFDSYYNDFTRMRVTWNSYNYLASRIRSLGIPVIASLEGGYSVGLSRGLPAFIKGFITPLESAGESTSSSKYLWSRYMELNNASTL